MEIIIVLGNSKEDVMRARVKRAVDEFNAEDELCEFDDNGGKIKPIRTILCSGGSSRGLSAESIKMKEYAIQLGMNEHDVNIETDSRNTIENLQFSRKLINDVYKKETFASFPPTLVICTSSFHIKRTIVLANMTIGRDYDLKFIHTNETVSNESQQHEWMLLMKSIDSLCSLHLKTK